MILSKNLTQTLKYAQETSYDTYRNLINLIVNSPVTSWGEFNSSDVSMQSYGAIDGKFGKWTASVRLDENKKPNSMTIIFTSEKSSRLPYSDIYTLKLNGISYDNLSTRFKQPLVVFSQERQYNYRLMDRSNKNLTTSQIAAYSKPVTISDYILYASLDRNNKLVLTSNEQLGKQEFAYETQTLNLQPEEIEA